LAPIFAPTFDNTVFAVVTTMSVRLSKLELCKYDEELFWGTPMLNIYEETLRRAGHE
jgi:hypothetical protein